MLLTHWLVLYDEGKDHIIILKDMEKSEKIPIYSWWKAFNKNLSLINQEQSSLNSINIIGDLRQVIAY